jgi:chaperonin GroEL
MAKLLKFGIEAREELLEGARILAEAVGATLGPRSSNVAIERQWGHPNVIHDGVGVANEIELPDPWRNMGVRLLKDAAKRTNEAAGDGTTTATVLGHAVASEAHRNIVAGSQAMALRNGIERAAKAMDEELSRIAVPVRDDGELLQVATISAQNAEIGDLVADGIRRMGRDGVLAIEESPNGQTYIEIKQGMDFNRGYAHPVFITNPEFNEASLESPYVLVTDFNLTDIQDILFLTRFTESERENNNIVVIAEDISGMALATLIGNQGKTIRCIPVKAPGYQEAQKENLKDIATACGARFFSREAGERLTADNFDIADLGRAAKVTSTDKNTVIISGAGTKEAVEERISQLRDRAGKAETDFDREKLQERIARFTDGIGVIYVGGNSEAEVRERKERFIDALGATRAASDEGIVPGGETALVRAAAALSSLKAEGDEAIGIEIVRRASSRPFLRLMENAGYDGGRMLSELERVLKKRGWGIDVIDAVPKDMMEAGIIDPVKVTRHALMNAVSCAVMMMTTNVLVVEEPAKENRV